MIFPRISNPYQNRVLGQQFRTMNGISRQGFTLALEDGELILREKLAEGRRLAANLLLFRINALWCHTRAWMGA